MKRYLVKPPEVLLRDEAAMRAFYQSCGISSKTTEAAILVRRHKPYEETSPSILNKTPPEEKDVPGTPAKS